MHIIYKFEKQTHKMNKLISKSWQFLEDIGANIQYAGDSKIYTRWNNKDVTDKKYKFIITINDSRWISASLESFIKSRLKDGVIFKSNIIDKGHSICGRCNGEGKVKYGCDGGWCFKCDGAGILWKFN